jgi:hypothetical protein
LLFATTSGLVNATPTSSNLACIASNLSNIITVFLKGNGFA